MNRDWMAEAESGPLAVEELEREAIENHAKHLGDGLREVLRLMVIKELRDTGGSNDESN